MSITDFFNLTRELIGFLNVRRAQRRALLRERDGDPGRPVHHSLAKALSYFEPDPRLALIKGGFLTRDSRVVEGQDKPGQRFEFSKR